MHKFCTYHSNRVRPWLVAQIGGDARHCGRRPITQGVAHPDCRFDAVGLEYTIVEVTCSLLVAA
jgi:hypothetical protein